MTNRAHSLEEHTRAVAAMLPGGRTFEAKERAGSNLRDFLRGLSNEFVRSEEYLLTLEKEYFPDATVLFLTEWEQALGIPDDCFKNTGTDEERLRNILTKLTSLGVQTVLDFEALALTFGVVVDVLPGVDSGVSFPSIRDARYTIVVNLALTAGFTYTFPFPFGTEVTALLECIFQGLIPSNCQVLFQEV